MQHPGPGLEDDDALDRWTLRYADTGHHSSSTCRMGAARDPLAVADQRGKVYGAEGLWVVDGSTLPETVLMLAEKIADSLR